jgi:hypothetical protein
VVGTSSGAASLTVLWSDINFGPASGTVSNGVGGTLAVSNGQVTSVTTWRDSGNVASAQTTSLTSQGPFGPSNPGNFSGSSFGSLAAGSPYSLTLRVDLAHIASGTSSYGDDLKLVPEPNTWVLCAVGLAGLFLVSRRAPRSVRKTV